jgi:hypothetical protein
VPALLVFVTHLVPDSELEPDEVLPGEVDGVPIKVVPLGDVRPQQQAGENP